MTLIVAIGCTDGVVIAADSASSDPESGVKQPYDKIKRLGKEPILYGGSGDVGLLQTIDDNLAAYSPRTSPKSIRQEIKRLVVPELKQSTELHAPYPRQPYNLPPVAVLLFAGIAGGKQWILEIERDGRHTFYGESFGNFCAIGSGKPWAQAIFRPHLMTERDLQLGKVFACRVLDDSIKLAAAFLAKPIYIHTISLDGTISKVDEPEFSEIAKTCELWRTLERETVGRLLAPAEVLEAEPEVPAPHQIVSSDTPA